jgi:YHS domain-containing protein
VCEYGSLALIQKMKKVILFATFYCCAQLTFAQEVFMKSGEAIRGYDAVAYFKENKPVKGKNEFTFEWKGAVWKFSSAQNLADFKNDPEKFAPQYGGYCAFGMAENHKATTQPEAFTVVDGKLYLNYDTNVKSRWNESQQKFIEDANRNWPQVKLERD